MKTITTVLVIAGALGSFGGAAFASESKYLTGFQYDGAGAMEGEITFSPADGGKAVKSVAIVSYVGKPGAIESTRKQPWKSEAELAKLYLEPCVANGGALVNVTVKAGTFEACKTVASTPEVEITKWMGKVSPAGMIRMVLKKKGIQTREELTDYAP